MKQARWPLALLLLSGLVAELRSQVPFFPPGFERFAGGSGIGFSRHGRRYSFSAYLSNSYAHGYYPVYPAFGYPVNNVTVINNPPPTVVVAPQTVVVGQPVDRGDDEVRFRGRQPPEDWNDPEKFDVIRPRRKQLEEVREKPEPPLAGAPASVFRPVGPAERARARQEVPAEPAPLVKPRPPAPEPPPRRPARPQEPAERNASVAAGKRAFAEEEYGRAERRFRQATIDNPDEARSYFLLAQAQFALAKFQEAVASIHAGMRLQPGWPRTAFRVRELYGANVADFPEHLQRLADTFQQHPQDPVLLFLYGYELWFDGRQEEARPYFRRARTLAPDKTDSDRFLQTEAAPPLAAK